MQDIQMANKQVEIMEKLATIFSSDIIFCIKNSFLQKLDEIGSK